MGLVGSEMCIRDRTFDRVNLARELAGIGDPAGFPHVQAALAASDSCLLYTSDAADEN